MYSFFFRVTTSKALLTGASGAKLEYPIFRRSHSLENGLNRDIDGRRIGYLFTVGGNTGDRKGGGAADGYCCSTA